MLEIVRTIQLFPKCMNNVLNAIRKQSCFGWSFRSVSNFFLLEIENTHKKFKTFYENNV